MKFIIKESQYKRLLSEQKVYTSKTEYDKAIVQYEKELKRYNIEYSKYQKELIEFNKVWGTPIGKELIKQYGYGAVVRKGAKPIKIIDQKSRTVGWLEKREFRIPYPPKLNVKKPEKPIYQEPSVTTNVIDHPVIEKPKPADPVKTDYVIEFLWGGNRKLVYFKTYDEWSKVFNSGKNRGNSSENGSRTWAEGELYHNPAEFGL